MLIKAKHNFLFAVTSTRNNITFTKNASCFISSFVRVISYIALVRVFPRHGHLCYALLLPRYKNDVIMNHSRRKWWQEMSRALSFRLCRKSSWFWELLSCFDLSSLHGLFLSTLPCATFIHCPQAEILLNERCLLSFMNGWMFIVLSCACSWSSRKHIVWKRHEIWVIICLIYLI